MTPMQTSFRLEKYTQLGTISWVVIVQPCFGIRASVFSHDYSSILMPGCHRAKQGMHHLNLTKTFKNLSKARGYHAHGQMAQAGDLSLDLVLRLG